MFNLVDKHKRIIQVVLALVTLPFAFFGIDSYFNGGGGGPVVAKVGDQKITQQQFLRALEQRQEEVQTATGGRAPQSELDSPAVRHAVLDSIIRQQLLLDSAQRAGLAVSARELRDTIAAIPAFQENGRFSFQRYKDVLQTQEMTPEIFEARLRQQIVMQQLNDAYGDSNFVPHTIAQRFTSIIEQQREVSQAVIPSGSFIPQVKLAADAAQKYYDAHPAEFTIPEAVRVQYLVLSVKALMPQVKVDPAEIQRYYDEHQQQLGVPETRKASHILIAVSPNASAAEVAKARAKAEKIYEEAKKDPASFAALAKKYSQDPGSAAEGGNLGFFPRGTMPAAFDKAVFSMKVGEISPPVRTKYGFHIIELTAVRPATVPPLAQVRNQIVTEIEKQHADQRFDDLADKFTNLVYEQSDSLKPAAELVHLPVQESGWITRAQADDPQLNNPHLLKAIFSGSVLKDKRNTEAIQIGSNTLVSARVTAHRPATLKPFAEVSAAIVKSLTAKAAAQLAEQQGKQDLASLKSGKAVDLQWGAPQLVSRSDPKGLSQAVLTQVLMADATKLPAFSGVEGTDGSYTLLKITKVTEPAKIAPDKEKEIATALDEAWGQAQFAAYLTTLRQSAHVKINEALVEKK